MRTQIYLLAAFLVGQTGCTGDEIGNLRLRLIEAGFEEPTARVDQFVVTAYDESDAIAWEAKSQGASGPQLLGSVNPGASWSLRIEGRNAGSVVASGVSRLLPLSSSSDNEEWVPFASPRVAVALPADRAISGAQSVDGRCSEWASSPSLMLGDAQRTSGPQASDRDLRVELFLAWQTQTLRFCVVVLDDCPAFKIEQPAGSCGQATAVDELRLGFDGLANGGTSYGDDDIWLEITPLGVTVREGSLVGQPLDIAVAPLSDGRTGWAVEGSLEARALGRQGGLNESLRVGFDIGIIDQDPQKSEPTILRWSGTSVGVDLPSSPAAMGSLGFGVP
jgi:hypothetical protein